MTLLKLVTYLSDGNKNWQPKMLLSTLVGRNAAHHISAILDGLLWVKGALFARESLADHFGVGANFESITRGTVVGSGNDGVNVVWLGNCKENDRMTTANG